MCIRDSAYTSDREAEPIALALCARGFHACVLRYPCAPARFPAALRHGCARGAGGRGNAAGRRSFQRRRNNRLAAGLSGFDKGV